MAFAEVDKTRWGGVLEKEGWSEANGYTDWRKVFENHAKELDVVFVATPDHNHFAPSMTAVSMGIHCYTEKPLTWSVREAQLLEKAYEKNKNVVTQMGNQGHAGDGWRMAYEYHPSRRHGRDQGVPHLDEPSGLAARRRPSGLDRPRSREPGLGRLDRLRPHAPLCRSPRKASRRAAAPITRSTGAAWSISARGALGDMACHTTDGSTRSWNPGYAATAEPIVMTDPVGDQWPGGMVVKCTYRAKGETARLRHLLV